MQKKAVFVDTNIYLACAAAEFDDNDIDVLEKIKSKQDSGEILLVLPQVIRNEVERLLRGKFKLFRDSAMILDPKKEIGRQGGKPNEKPTLKLLDEIKQKEIEKANEQVIIKIKERERSAEKLLDQIFSHKNAVEIPLTEPILLKALCRSALAKRPAAPDLVANKTHYLKDIDCVAWESVLVALGQEKRLKNIPLLVCTNDGDYYEGFESEELHADLKTDTNGLVKSLKGHRSPLEMLNTEFKAKYTKTQQEKFEAASVTAVYPWSGSVISGGLGGAVTANTLASAPSTFTISSSGVGLGASLRYPFSDSATIPADSKYCPFCSANIESLISPTSISLGYAYGVVNEIYCPSCSKQLRIAPKY